MSSEALKPWLIYCLGYSIVTNSSGDVSSEGGKDLGSAHYMSLKGQVLLELLF